MFVDVCFGMYTDTDVFGDTAGRRRVRMVDSGTLDVRNEVSSTAFPDLAAVTGLEQEISPTNSLLKVTEGVFS